MKLLDFDFEYRGPWGEEMAEALEPLARDIAGTQGLRWKLWIENRAAGTAGGIYLFDDEPTARTYAAMHEERLAAFGIQPVRVRIYDVNAALSRITRGPLVAVDEMHA